MAGDAAPRTGWVLCCSETSARTFIANYWSALAGTWLERTDLYWAIGRGSRLRVLATNTRQETKTHTPFVLYFPPLGAEPTRQLSKAAKGRQAE